MVHVHAISPLDSEQEEGVFCFTWIMQMKYNEQASKQENKQVRAAHSSLFSILLVHGYDAI